MWTLQFGNVLKLIGWTVVPIQNVPGTSCNILNIIRNPTSNQCGLHTLQVVFYLYVTIAFVSFFGPLFKYYLSSPVFQVLVPLVLLQALQSEGQPMTTLLHLGLRFLEEAEADYIIQQGGWVSYLTFNRGDLDMHTLAFYV